MRVKRWFLVYNFIWLHPNLYDNVSINLIRIKCLSLLMTISYVIICTSSKYMHTQRYKYIDRYIDIYGAGWKMVKMTRDTRYAFSWIASRVHRVQLSWQIQVEGEGRSPSFHTRRKKTRSHITRVSKENVLWLYFISLPLPVCSE